jgi:hypothetical protein
MYICNHVDGLKATYLMFDGMFRTRLHEIADVGFVEALPKYLRKIAASVM